MVSDVSPTRTDTAANRRAGFTIMELMIVLVIVGIMAMSVAPSLSEVLSNNRHANAAMDLMRFVRRARSQSIATGKAQLIRYQSDGANGLGRVDAYAGISNRCRQTPWEGPNGAFARTNRAMAFDMTDYNPSAIGAMPKLDDPGRQVMVLTAGVPVVTTPTAEVWVCYQPDGLVYVATAEASGLRVQDLPVEFQLRRERDRVRHGLDRMVVLPPGGNARLQ